MMTIRKIEKKYRVVYRYNDVEYSRDFYNYLKALQFIYELEAEDKKPTLHQLEDK